MDMLTCEVRINDLVLEMNDEGILNEQFTILVGTRRAGDHLFVMQVIHSYCTLIERALTAISYYMRQPHIDYARATVWAGQLRTRACSAGTESFRIAFLEFMMASTFEDKEQCMDWLHILYREYFRLRARFMTILQMEVRIFCLKQQAASTLHVD